MSPRPDVKAAVGELALLRGSSGAADRRVCAAEEERPTVRADLRLPTDVVARAKQLGRPQRTGARRSLSAAVVLQAYVLALDELGLDVDMRGVDRDSETEATRRVAAALEAWAQAHATGRAES